MRALALSLTLLAAASWAAPCPTRASWPTTEWPAMVDQTTAAKAAEIRALEDYAFTLTGTDDERLGLRTDGLLIIKSGTVVYERYARGWDASKRHISWSVAKSISSALTGIAVKQGALQLSDSICSWVKGLRDELCHITVGDLVQFGSGTHWQEEYEHGGYQASSVISMLLGEGHRDWVKFLGAQKVDVAPGARFQYSTGEATFLAAAVRGALEPRLGKDWPWVALFDPIGMGGTVFEGDTQGNPAGGSYVFATARDFARFGYLYLNDGCWADQRLLPEDWVKTSTQVSAAFKASAPATQDTPNGYMWWLNQTAPTVSVPPWKDAPADAYAAIGHWGQFVVVVPSRDVVIVRLGDDRNDGVDLNQLIPLALAVVP